MVLSTSTDGFTAGTPLEALTDERNALIAIAMNREPLTPEHGFPARLVVPGLYGYVSATKWVTDLKVTRFADDEGYWTPRGWSARGPVKMSSRIDVPGGGDRIAPGTVAVAGVAWAQHTGIRAVQVRVDDGPWQAARLGADATVDAWRQWVFSWRATPGSTPSPCAPRTAPTPGRPRKKRPRLPTAPPATTGSTWSCSDHGARWSSSGDHGARWSSSGEGRAAYRDRPSHAGRVVARDEPRIETARATLVE
ncbi:molybdopterin-dependent oxidoreductase [Barrientosiimonas endolithica]